MEPSEIQRIEVTEEDFLEALETLRVRGLGGLRAKFKPGCFVHPQEVVGCMTGQLVKLSSAADEVLYSDDTEAFEERCVKTAYAILFGLASVRRIRKTES